MKLIKGLMAKRCWAGIAHTIALTSILLLVVVLSTKGVQELVGVTTAETTLEQTLTELDETLPSRHSKGSSQYDQLVFMLGHLQTLCKTNWPTHILPYQAIFLADYLRGYIDSNTFIRYFTLPRSDHALAECIVRNTEK